MSKITFVFKGGAGSGHHGHEGRPGKKGGSVPGSGGVAPDGRSGTGGINETATDKTVQKLLALPAYKWLKYKTPERGQREARGPLTSGAKKLLRQLANSNELRTAVENEILDLLDEDSSGIDITEQRIRNVIETLRS